MRLRGQLLWTAIAVILLLAVSALLVWQAFVERVPRPGTLTDVRATAVAGTAERAQTVVEVGPTAQPAIVVGGVAMTGMGRPLPTQTPDQALPPPVPVTDLPEEPVTPAPTPEPTAPAVVVDPLRGLAAVKVGTPANGSGLTLGSSQSLREGEELVLSPGEGPTVVVVYAGRSSVPLGTSGLQQQVLSLRVPGPTPPRGFVLDREARLVGIVVPERQGGAPEGHLYAVPVEQAAPLLRQAGVAVRP